MNTTPKFLARNAVLALALSFALMSCSSDSAVTVADTSAPTDTVAADAVSETAATAPGTIQKRGILVSSSSVEGECDAVLKVNGTDETMKYPDCSSLADNVGNEITLTVSADGSYSFELNVMNG